MMNRVTRAIGIAGMLSLLTLGGCSSDSKHEESVQRSPVSIDSVTGAVRFYEGAREVIDSMRVDFSGGGEEYLVIASRPLDGSDAVLTGAHFDLVEIFALDSAGRPYSVFVDPVENGENMRTEDLNGNGRLELLVTLNAGGNDPMTSIGLVVYGLTPQNSFSTMFVSPAGAPELRDLNGDGSKEILLSDVLYGMMAHSDAVGYTEGIYAFDGTAWVRANEAFASYYEKQVAARRDAYMKLRASAQRGDDYARQVHAKFIDWMTWAYAMGSIHEARQVLDSQRAFLDQVLAPEQIEGLDAVIDELEVMAQQQQKKQGPAI